MAKKGTENGKSLASKNTGEPLKIGTRVKIADLGGQLGRIVEDRGNLGPKGARINGILLLRKPRRDYIELREDQVEPVEVQIK